eukprot:scaffold1829_cov249-Pinguiococcus_pyrenoidosus.AAC.1
MGRSRDSTVPTVPVHEMLCSFSSDEPSSQSESSSSSSGGRLCPAGATAEDLAGNWSSEAGSAPARPVSEARAALSRLPTRRKSLAQIARSARSRTLQHSRRDKQARHSAEKSTPLSDTWAAHANARAASNSKETLETWQMARMRLSRRLLRSEADTGQRGSSRTHSHRKTIKHLAASTLAASSSGTDRAKPAQKSGSARIVPRAN